MARKSGGRSRQQAAQPTLRDLPTGPVQTSLAQAELVARDSGLLLLLDGTESSFIDLRDPTYLDFEYQQQMNAVLDVFYPVGMPVRAVHLGGAGCALARAWDALRPRSSQLAVEIDEILANSVRAWFELPRSPALRIRVGDAAAVAPTLRPDSWDVAVRDVFVSGTVPESVRGEKFAQACAQALTPTGLYLANAASQPREVAAAELSAVRSAFTSVLVVADPAVVRGRRRGNLLFVASKQEWTPAQYDAVERAVRKLPLPARSWRGNDRELPT